VKERSRAEVHLGRRQVVLLSAGLVIVFALVFILGILVGREFASTTHRVAAAPPPQATPATVPSSDAAKNARANMKEKLTFYQTLTSPTPDIPPPGATPRRKVVEERMVVKGPEQRSVVEPATPGAAPSAPAATVWTLQVSSFRSRALAEEQVKRLMAKGYDAYFAVVQSENGQARYRVRVGSFGTRTEAESVADRLRGDLKLNPFVTRRS